jgi:predicted RNA binding protein YcfA (HicA-like mRNA interferase family)
MRNASRLFEIVAQCSAYVLKSDRLLERDGWTLCGVKGSHHMFTHPQKPGHVAVQHPKKDLGTGLVASILKQAGLKGAKP